MAKRQQNVSPYADRSLRMSGDLYNSFEDDDMVGELKTSRSHSEDQLEREENSLMTHDP